MKIVMKFGGTSVANGKRMRASAYLVKNNLPGNKISVVVSAMDNVTDLLIVMADKARNGLYSEVEKSFKDIREKHENAIRDAFTKQEDGIRVLSFINTLFQDLERIFTGVHILRELTPRARDQILSFGERLSAAIFKEILVDLGVDAEYFTGGDVGIVTDDSFGEASPLIDVSRMKIQSRLGPILEEDRIPVVTGFIGVNQNGDITTLGRGGSDYTATILAVSLDVDEVWLWTDVDGIMTADPKIIRNARMIPSLSYDEASEMAVFGAKAMHPRALEPVAERGIPVRIKNSFNPSSPGTLINREMRVKGRDVVKAVALIEDVGTINIAGGGMVGRPGTSAKVFDVLGKNNINILMISQSVSEANITLLVRSNDLHKAVSALEIALLGKGTVNEVNFEDDVSVIAVLGAGMKGTQGVAARVFKAVSEKGINVSVIAQGSSELNISFVVKTKNCREAVESLHSEFSLGEP